VKRAAVSGRILLLLACCLQASLAASADRIRIFAAGPDQGVQMQMGRDLGRHIARAADIELDVRSVAGSPDALLRLRESVALQLALLQSDVAHAYLGAEARGNPDARQLLAPVRVVAPLHDEEIHFIVRGDSPMNSLHDLAQARINLGPLHSGSALTAATLYRLLFGTSVPDGQASFLPHEDALVKLITEQTVDAVAIVAPQPAKLLADMKPEARRFVKLLKFDAAHPSAAAALKVYSAATAAAASYPSLLQADLPALAVKIYLVASGHKDRSEAVLSRLAGAWCKNLPRLKAEGHPKWGNIELSLQGLAPGWAYARPVEREMRACLEGKRPPPEPCTPEDRTLGLCG
jgi:hypothetical protein